MPLLCDPQTAAVYLQGDFQDSAFLAGPGGSPQQRHSLLQSTPAFGYGFSPEQQLLQRLQALSRYQMLYQPQTTSLFPGTTPQFRVSPQPPSYTGSPVLTHREHPLQQDSSATANTSDETQLPFIRPLSQVGTITTADPDGRMRVIVPVPTAEDAATPQTPTSPKRQQQQQQQLQSALTSLRVSEDPANSRRLANGPPLITRSTSEKVPNRSELMSQVQRTAWARHTTKWQQVWPSGDLPWPLSYGGRLNASHEGLRPTKTVLPTRDRSCWTWPQIHDTFQKSSASLKKKKPTNYLHSEIRNCYEVLPLYCMSELCNQYISIC